MSTTARNFARATALAALGALAAASGRADDRDLLRNTQDDPYVFILFDVSGSMNWQPAGDAWAPASADDPAAKFYQAKSGLYRVLKATDDINFGFATFNQDNLHAVHKHFLYRLAEDQTALPWIADSLATIAWPSTSDPLTFGPNAGIDGGNDTLSSCGNGPNLNQTGNAYLEARGELNRFPKLGFPGSPVTTTEYFRNRVSGNTRSFRIDWTRVAGALGDDSITVRMRVRRCDISGYDSGNVERTFVRYYTQDNRGLPLTGASDFLWWERDGDVGPGGVPAGFFDYTQTNPNGTCNGWEPNGTTNDAYNGYNIKQPGVADDPLNRCSTCLDRGDVIPLDWDEDVWLTASCPAGIACNYTNRDLILTRLAPNLIAEGIDATPDLRSAHYFNGTQTSGILNLRDSTQRPLVASGSTPIGFSMDNFRTWYNSWKPVAAAEDNRFGCKKVTLLIITDGDDTCPGMNPATVAADLLNSKDVETYIIGFGLPTGGGNTLVATTCAGGGQAPDPDGPGPLPPPACTTSPTNDHLFLPNNEDELVDALVATFASIKETAAAFASAAAPTLQANVEDKVIISSFTPLAGETVWAGRLDAFLKPVPVTGDGKPDRTQVCAPGDTSECLLWDAGDSQPDVPGGADYQPRGLLLQAPTAAEVDLADTTTLQLGDGADERRVFYGQFESGRPGGTIWVSTPPTGNRKLLNFPPPLSVPAGDQDRRDLWEGLGLPFTPGDPTSEGIAYDDSVKVIANTLQERETEITDPFDGSTSDLTYLLGDVFHSNPRVVDQPGSFNYYTTDPYAGVRLCGADPDPNRTPPVSYKWFADQHLCRRKMLMVGSNDGQLHVFDAGKFQGTDCKLPTLEDRDGDGSPDGDGDPLEGDFDNGTGRELFSYVPRQMLPHLLDLTTETEQSWGMDNSTRVDDVFIDPAAAVSGAATCLDREWRTVLIGSYREGGSGYFALDITQPDVINASNNVPQPINGYVPSCLDGGSACGDRAFPSALWEFIDSVPGNVAAQLDEDRNNWPDLGNTWSVPATARIRVCNSSCDADSVEDRFVAVFGGGLGDPPTRPTGNFVYMVDIETGKVLWKKPVNGSVPADITTVVGGDGYLKTLYFGTTSGRVYKTVFESGPMRLADVTIQTRIGGTDVDVVTQRLVGPPSEVKRYDPFVIFVTNGTPIYQELAAVYVQQRQTYALGIGTGNRWNLWEPTADRGRFYMLLDTGFRDDDHNGTLDTPCGGCPTPLNESVYHALDPDSSPDDLTNYLTDANDSTPGWYMNLGAGERVITEGFALSGITIFTSFLPDEVENPDGTCSRTGESHIFIVGTVTGAGYWFPDPDDVNSRARYFTSAYFTSAPFVERGSTGNQSDPGGGGTNADQLTESLVKVKEELKRLFPPNCRFGNYTQNVKSLRQDTQIVFIAPVPICIEPTNFKEF